MIELTISKFIALIISSVSFGASFVLFIISLQERIKMTRKLREIEKRIEALNKKENDLFSEE